MGDPRAVQYRLTTRGVGQASLLTIIRKGQRIQVELRLEAAPKPGRDDVRNLTGQHPFDGLRVANLSPALADELGIEAESGVVILQVRPDSVAARLGFSPGDIVARIGDSEIDVIATLEETLKKRPRTWGVAVKRGTQVMTLQVPG